MESTGQQIDQRKVGKPQKKTKDITRQSLTLILPGSIPGVDRAKGQPIEETRQIGRKKRPPALNLVSKVVCLIMFFLDFDAHERQLMQSVGTPPNATGSRLEQ